MSITRWAVGVVIVPLCSGHLGCGDREGGGALEWPREAKTALFAIQPPGQAMSSFVLFDGTELQTAQEARLPRGGRAEVLGFSEGLSELQLPSGPFEMGLGDLDDTCEELRARPLPAVVVHLTSEDGAGWQVATASTTVFEGLRLPPLDVEACFLRGMCVSPDRMSCTRECSDTRPASPNEPRRVANPRRCASCSDEPFPTMDQPCGEAERFGLEEGTCVALGRVCPLSLFPEITDNRPTVYVQAGGTMGGDGSLARPFARVQDALQQTESGTRVVLSRGVHDIGELSAETVWLEGACTGEAHLRGQLSLTGSSTIAQLLIEGSLDVQSDAELSMSSTHLRVPDLGRGFWVQGTTFVRDVRIEGATQVEAQAELRVRTSDLGGTLVLGAVTIQDSVVSGRVRGEPSARATLIHTLVLGADPHPSALHFGALSKVLLQDVVVRSEQASGNGATFAGAEVEVQRVLVGGAERFAITISSGTLSGQDLSLRGPRSALDASPVSLFASNSDITISGLDVQGPTEWAINALGDRHRFDVEDFSVRGADIGLRFDNGDLRIARARIQEIRNTGALITGRSEIDIIDLSILGPVQKGLEIGDDFLDQIQGQVRALDIRGATSAALLVRRLGVTWQDVTTVGGPIGIDLTLGGTLLSDAIGRFERVRLVGHETALFLEGLNPAFGPRFFLRDFRIEGSGTGVSLQNCWLSQGPLFSAMQMQDVERPVFFLMAPR